MTTDTPILQFGTSRFLLAHADLFISQALEKGEALGRIAIVQTTGNAESLKRVAALNDGTPYPVRIRGIRDGQEVDEEIPGKAVARADGGGRLGRGAAHRLRGRGHSVQYG